ncbi:unnamed protein product [Notodromas monacha]|uniref:Thymidylate kinase n=1 Tax=Notodromas monacha TaxID=399045 RepID=A0A7R9BK42_9CRUS|nr:unnamed protein product [Notodromas monacha]CAG0916959.1 unnamed protein product [Notodromas monacha]
MRTVSQISRGCLVVLEGGDYAGKTTQATLLVKRLQEAGHPAKFLRFPDRTTPIGHILDGYLKQSCNLHDYAVHLLFSANRWEAEPQMVTDLMNGTILVVDRYAFSGVAYTCAKPGMVIERCKQTDVGLPRPDVALYLKLSEEAFQTRRSERCNEERYEQIEIQRKVMKNLEALSDPTYWKTVSADKSVEGLNDEIYSIVTDTLKKCRNTDIPRLWVD